MDRLKLLRSMLFVPANNWRLIQSAKDEKPDAIILDLEDAVPMREKETARWLAKDAIGLLKEAGHNVVIRVNGLATGLTKEDLKFVIRERIDAIMLPKSESRDDILELEKLMEGEEGPAEIGIIPLVESAKGILNVNEIVTASKRVVAVGFGAADYMRDFGRSYFAISPEETELLYPRSRLALAARVAGIPAIDTPFLGLIIDKEGLIKESKIALSLGFKGKMCIHPTHIEPINLVFSPSEKDVNSAKKVIEAYEEAKARGLGAASVDGRMIDEVTYKMAKEILALHEMVVKRMILKSNM
ncbi:MAG: CoA ester lyase [Candidatus Nezhaarchaeales archaeon]